MQYINLCMLEKKLNTNKKKLKKTQTIPQQQKQKQDCIIPFK